MQSTGGAGATVLPIPGLLFASAHIGSSGNLAVVTPAANQQIIIYSAVLSAGLAMSTDNTFGGLRQVSLQDSSGTVYLQITFPTIATNSPPGYQEQVIPLVFNGALVAQGRSLMLVTDGGQVGQALNASTTVAYILK